VQNHQVVRKMQIYVGILCTLRCQASPLLLTVLVCLLLEPERHQRHTNRLGQQLKLA
jgi:hypothetical protein